MRPRRTHAHSRLIGARIQRQFCLIDLERKKSRSLRAERLRAARRRAGPLTNGHRSAASARPQWWAPLVAAAATGGQAAATRAPHARRSSAGINEAARGEHTFRLSASSRVARPAPVAQHCQRAAAGRPPSRSLVCSRRPVKLNERIQSIDSSYRSMRSPPANLIHGRAAPPPPVDRSADRSNERTNDRSIVPRRAGDENDGQDKRSESNNRH
jgi:hypothetical protein